MTGFFSKFLGQGSGGLEHHGNGTVTPQQVANPQQQLGSGNASAAGVPGAPVLAPDNKPTPDPLNAHLEDMSRVWNTATTADGKPIAPQADPLALPVLNFKNEDVMTASGKLDFMSSVNPELVTKALGGDAAAFADVINTAVRQAFGAATINTGQMVNGAFNTYSRQIDQALPTRLRNHEIATRQSDDPILSHPAVAPMVAAMKGTVAAKNPQLSPEQVQRVAEEYVKGLGTAFDLGNTKKEEVTKQKEQTDWIDWAGIKL